MQKTIRTLALCAAVMCVATATRAQDTDVDVNNTQAPPPGPQTFVYSQAYERRATIHRYASLATLPLFATELALGQSIYSDPNARTSAARGAHIAVGSAITGLFAVNSVTGVWNMWESRSDPTHRKSRFLHGFLMLGADAGFVATFATGPSGRADGDFDGSKQTHRTIALASIGIATGGYLMMLIGR